MDTLTDEEFIEFVESFKNGVYSELENGKYKNHNYYDSVSQLSKSNTFPFDSLVNNSSKMYGLDWIAKGYKKWMFLPKTTDAIFCKINEDNNVELHLIEFKFIASESNKSKINKLWKEIKNKNRIYNIFSNRFMQDFQNVKNNYADQMESNLQLKPYESLFIVLPELYDEYCKKNSIDKKDIKTYLNNIDKYLWICVGNKSRNESNVRVQAKHFEKYFKRMEQGIFKTAKVKTISKFSKIINRIV